MNRLTLIVCIVAGLLCLCATSVLAQQLLTVVVDENGHGTEGGFPITGTIAVDPDSQLSTLRYRLGLGFPNHGDVLLTNPLDITPQNSTGISDLIRFNGDTGDMYFFSLIDDSGPPDLADVPAFPAISSNNVTVPENGPEGNNSTLYIPSSTQPGGDGSTNFTRQYTFISDVPEPCSALLACAGAGMILRRRKGVHN
jgi:hypothetical protein